jgi:hypothetical protein
MLHQRRTNKANLLCLLVGLYAIGAILGSCSIFDLNGRSISLATAFVSSSSIHGDTTSMKGKGTSDNDDDTNKSTVVEQSDSAVLSETGTIEQTNEATPVQPLLLPPGDESDENVTSIKLGETISFAELGPIILNTDGTTRRIDNWKTLTKQEQETTWRRIQKRNAERREQLLLEQEKQKQTSINDSNSE